MLKVIEFDEKTGEGTPKYASHDRLDVLIESDGNGQPSQAIMELQGKAARDLAIEVGQRAGLSAPGVDPTSASPFPVNANGEIIGDPKETPKAYRAVITVMGKIL